MPRSSYANKRSQAPKLVDVFPRHDLSNRIGPRDKEQIGIGSLGTQLGKRVNCVGNARSVDIDP